MFVRPEQIAAVIKRHPEINKARLVVDSENAVDTMTLLCEADNYSDLLSEEIKSSLKEVCKLRGDVSFVAIDELASDGKVIDDVRSYE